MTQKMNTHHFLSFFLWRLTHHKVGITPSLSDNHPIGIKYHSDDTVFCTFSLVTVLSLSSLPPSLALSLSLSLSLSLPLSLSPSLSLAPENQQQAHLSICNLDRANGNGYSIKTFKQKLVVSNILRYINLPNNLPKSGATMSFYKSHVQAALIRLTTFTHHYYVH